MLPCAPGYDMPRDDAADRRLIDAILLRCCAPLIDADDAMRRCAIYAAPPYSCRRHIVLFSAHI